MKAYILAGGKGSRLWPYNEYRNKASLPIANRPLAVRTVEAVCAAGADSVVIAGSHQMAGLQQIFFGDPRVTVVETRDTSGSAETLEAALAAVPCTDDAIVLFGDCLYSASDLDTLVRTHRSTASGVTALLSQVRETDDAGDWIFAHTDDSGAVTSFAGHTDERTYQVMEAFAFRAAPANGQPFAAYLPTAGVFPGSEIGGMPPRNERHVESALHHYTAREGAIPACVGTGTFVDIDKPWHIMEACYTTVWAETAALTANKLADGASIDPTAQIKGFVQLGKNSRIGRNVIINGSVIVGDNTVIDNGAIIDGDAVIGDRVQIRNYCYIEGGSTIGHGCKVLHAAEFDGVLFDGAYLYHYMEIHGLLGVNVDIGASCVCGTLRFDNKASRHTINGRKETPRFCANATYIGDHSRTGVNCTFYPGVTIGCNVAVGPGVVVTEDIPSNEVVLLKQELIHKPWGPEKYGW